MAREQIISEHRGEVVLITLNRPERLSAWTPRMTAELTHFLATRKPAFR